MGLKRISQQNAVEYPSQYRKLGKELSLQRWRPGMAKHPQFWAYFKRFPHPSPPSSLSLLPSPPPSPSVSSLSLLPPPPPPCACFFLAGRHVRNDAWAGNVTAKREHVNCRQAHAPPSLRFRGSEKSAQPYGETVPPAACGAYVASFAMKTDRNVGAKPSCNFGVHLSFSLGDENVPMSQVAARTDFKFLNLPWLFSRFTI